MTASVRRLAVDAIEAVLRTAGASPDFGIEPSELGPEDRRLFHELTWGVLREWLFLGCVVAKSAKQSPQSKTKTLLALSAYQLLFLERVPAYAVFSEAKKIGEALGLSEPESKFVHAVLKSIEREKTSLLEARQKALSTLREGSPPSTEFEWAVLNAPQALLDALTVLDADGSGRAAKKAARARAVKALAAMRARPPLVGYALPRDSAVQGHRPFRSAVAPLALALESGAGLSEDLRRGVVRVQGEASQWACDRAARWLLDRCGAGRELSVVEMAAGKGGKLFGTLAAMSALLNGREFPRMRWLAADASSEQLALLESDLPLVREYWPSVDVRLERTAWSSPSSMGTGPFDLVWLDAPCTGFGTLAKLPAIGLVRGEHAYEEAKRLALLQMNLCETGWRLRANGGVLFYTVCTLTHPETHAIVSECRRRLGASLEFQDALWPGAEPAPLAEGFFAVMFS